MIGRNLGHYRILELLGKGGMGDVYLAEDVRLQRQVALKVLNPDLAADVDRRERFEREARAAAALNHPNIVTIHSVEEADGVAFLTLELVDGQTLTDLIPATGLPIDRLLAIAIPLTDAVGAAHQRGITHRDLKPANVMITRDHRVKVLDFGLAKLKDPAQADAAMPTQELTGEGRILGTVAYMAPEQAEGKLVDQRTDVFSLGIILHEMATGVRPFKGDTQMAVLSSIIRDTPSSISDLKRDLPRDFGRIVKRCLAKDPEDRYQTAKDLRNDLRALREELTASVNAPALEATLQSTASPPRPRARASRSVLLGGLALGIALAGIALVVGLRSWRGSPAAPTPSGATSLPFERIALTRLTTTGTAGLAALSADGRYVAHVVTDEKGQSLWLRQVATSSNVQIVAPAEVRYAGVTFSPDGDHVYYVAYPAGQNIATLSQVPVLGGGVRKIVDDIDSAPTFSPDRKFFCFVRGLGDDSALMVAEADGGNVRQLALRRLPKRFGLQSVTWSPDGRRIAATGLDDSNLTGEIVIVDSTSGREEDILGEREWRSVNSLAWWPDGTGLVAGGQEAGGEGINQIWFVGYPAGGRRKITNDLSNYAGLSLARDGRALVTVRGELRSNIWMGSAGSGQTARNITTSAGIDDGVQGLAWTPDGRIVYASSATGNSDIWLMNADGTNRVQLTTAPADDVQPHVTHDRRYIVFVSERDGTRALWRMDLNGSSQVRLGRDHVSRHPSLSRDGLWVFYTDHRGVNWRIDIDGKAASQVFGAEDAAQARSLPPGFHDAILSPDGQTVAGHYQDTTQRSERIALVPVKGPAVARLLPDVPNNAQWSPDGKHLVFFDTKGGVSNLWRKPISGGQPEQLTHFDSDMIFNYALAPDDGRIAIVRGARISDVVLLTARDVAPASPR
jgi:serine/threonine protein kinase/Tol biopolymer transport system component